MKNTIIKGERNNSIEIKKVWKLLNSRTTRSKLLLELARGPVFSAVKVHKFNLNPHMIKKWKIKYPWRRVLLNQIWKVLERDVRNVFRDFKQLWTRSEVVSAFILSVLTEVSAPLQAAIGYSLSKCLLLEACWLLLNICFPGIKVYLLP